MKRSEPDENPMTGDIDVLRLEFNRSHIEGVALSAIEWIAWTVSSLIRAASLAEYDLRWRDHQALVRGSAERACHLRGPVQVNGARPPSPRTISAASDKSRRDAHG